MEQNLVPSAIADNKDGMTSLEIAEVTGKQHAHVMRDIRNLIGQGVNQSNFGLVKYQDKKGEMRDMYSLTPKGCLILASGYDALLRERIIDRLETLEKSAKAQLPTTYLDALKALVASEEEKQVLAADNAKKQQAIEMKDAQIIELDTAVNNMKPKVSYVDNILQCKDTINVTQIAQDYGMSAKAFQRPAAQPEDTAQGGADMDSLRQVPRQGLRPVRDLHLHQGRRHTGRAHVHQVVTARTALSLRHPQVSQHHSINRKTLKQQ